ncbi:hypothetical protein TNCV_743991 [Trichonephila clavipes]|nr:hypothetical protein TNCV_743991 [Trichonephila clavipes]
MVAKANFRKVMNMKQLSTKEDFQMLPEELHQDKYKAISLPQDILRPVKDTIKEEFNTLFVDYQRAKKLK